MIKELMKSIREYKRDSILTPILVSLEVVMECIIPFVVAQLVNEIKAGSGMSVISRYGLILVVMALMSLAFGAGAGSVCASASCGFAKNLRKDMFYRIQDFSFENIDKFSTSSLVTRMTTDVMNVQLAFMMLIRLAIRSPLMLIFSFTMAFIMGGKMALIFLVVIPILGIGLFAVIHKVGPLFKRVFRKYDALNNSIQENVKGMRVVKSFVREEYEKEKFHHAAEEVCQDFTRAEKILAINSPLMQFCLYVVMIFVLSFGSYTIITSGGLDLDVGQFSALLVYSFQILNSLMMFSMVFVMVTMAGGIRTANRGSAKRGQYADKSCRPGGGSGRWFDRFRPCQLQIFSAGGEDGACRYRSAYPFRGDDWNYRWYRFFEVFPDPTDFQTL